MLLAALCLQASLLVRPLLLSEEPPELRSARNILILFDGPGSGPERDSGADARSREEALALAAELARRVGAGESFTELAARHSQASNAAQGALLGTFPRGLLDGPLDRFLFEAEVGETSAPILGRDGVHLLQRVETLAGVRHILCTGDGARARAEALLAELARGGDFAELARAHSQDALSAARGGALGIYERGPRDRLLKAAAFEASVGEVIGPLRTPLGWHLLQRVDPASLDPSLRETTLVRGQGILVAFSGSVAAPAGLNRPQEEAERFALAIHRDLVAGKPFEEAARAFNDDPGGKERAGDLGWIHRRHPDLPVFMERLFGLEPGELLGEPIQTSAGYVILRRSR